MSKYTQWIAKSIVLAAVAAAAPTSHAAWWQSAQGKKAAKPVVPLQSDFTNNWGVKSGDQQWVDEASLKHQILSVKSGQTLILDRQNTFQGSYVVRSLVRLRTDLGVGALATFSFGKKDSADPRVRVKLLASRNTELVQCSVDLGEGKPLHNIKALTAKLHWNVQNVSTYDYTL